MATGLRKHSPPRSRNFGTRKSTDRQEVELFKQMPFLKKSICSFRGIAQKLPDYNDAVTIVPKPVRPIVFPIEETVGAIKNGLSLETAERIFEARSPGEVHVSGSQLFIEGTFEDTRYCSGRAKIRFTDLRWSDLYTAPRGFDLKQSEELHKTLRREYIKYLRHIAIPLHENISSLGELEEGSTLLFDLEQQIIIFFRLSGIGRERFIEVVTSDKESRISIIPGTRVRIKRIASGDGRGLDAQEIKLFILLEYLYKNRNTKA